LFFLSSLETPWTVFSITTVPMARFSPALDLVFNEEDKDEEDEEQQQQHEEQQAQDGVWYLSMAKGRKRGHK
jgi:hypothetical protein